MIRIKEWASDIHLIAFDRLVYREIQLLALTLMTSNKARAPEMRMITEKKTCSLKLTVDIVLRVSI